MTNNATSAGDIVR